VPLFWRSILAKLFTSMPVHRADENFAHKVAERTSHTHATAPNAQALEWLNFITTELHKNFWAPMSSRCWPTIKAFLQVLCAWAQFQISCARRACRQRLCDGKQFTVPTPICHDAFGSRAEG